MTCASSPAGFDNGEEYFQFLKDSFDCLYAEGQAGSPKMMSLGLHCRLVGQPGRFQGLKKFVDYIRTFDKVWVPTRLDIARHWADYLYILPAFVVMLLVIGYPIYDTVYLSFFNTPPSLAMADKTYVGLDNYSRILGSDSFREVTINTLIWTVFSTVFAFILGLGAALSLNSYFVRPQHAARAVPDPHW